MSSETTQVEYQVVKIRDVEGGCAFIRDMALDIREGRATLEGLDHIVRVAECVRLTLQRERIEAVAFRCIREKLQRQKAACVRTVKRFVSGGQ